MGKLIKNIILFLIGFLILSVIIGAFTTKSDTKVVPLSDVANLLKTDKVESIEASSGNLKIKLKDSDEKLESNRLS
jgi:hypothetical protein